VSKTVRFGETKTIMFDVAADVWLSFGVKYRMKPYVRSLSDRNYKHETHVPSDEALRVAWNEASKLAAEVCVNNGGETPAAPAHQPFDGPKRWLIDTGSAFDLIEESDVPEWQLSDAEPAKGRIALNTANGKLVVDKQIVMQCGPLRHDVTPLLLPSSPAVLSVGRRCMKEGFSFVWRWL
jgi:hypothetical protein